MQLSAGVKMLVFSQGHAFRVIIPTVSSSLEFEICEGMNQSIGIVQYHIRSTIQGTTIDGIEMYLYYGVFCNFDKFLMSSRNISRARGLVRSFKCLPNYFDGVLVNLLQTRYENRIQSLSSAKNSNPSSLTECNVGVSAVHNFLP